MTNFLKKQLAFRLAGDAATAIIIPVVVFIAPCICIIWFTLVAVQNLELANQAKLSQFNRDRLTIVKTEWRQYWLGRGELGVYLTTEGREDSEDGRQKFATLASKGTASTFFVLDEALNIAYPSVKSIDKGSMAVEFPELVSAQRLEYTERKLPQALELAQTVFDHTQSVAEKIMAMQIMVRLGKRLNLKEAFYRKMFDNLDALKIDGRVSYENSVPVARLLSSLLSHLHSNKLIDGFEERTASIEHRLLSIINNYSNPLNSSQRVFFTRTAKIDAALVPTYPQESLALRWLKLVEDLNFAAMTLNDQNQAVGTLDTEVFYEFNLDHKIVAAYEKKFLKNVFDEWMRSKDYDLQFTLSHGGASEGLKTPYVELDDFMPAWRIYLLKGSEIKGSADYQSWQYKLYLGFSLLAVLLVIFIAWFLYHYLQAKAKLNTMRTEFITMVTHELKTPLSSINLFLELLDMSEVQRDEKTREYLALIGSENNRLVHLVENFLTFSRVEQGALSLSFKRLNLSSLLHEIIDQTRGRFELGGYQLHCEIRNDVFADIDEALIRLVVFNLLDNAYKYSKGQYKVLLSLSANEGEIEFSVSDSGIGISAEKCNKIFDRFYTFEQGSGDGVRGCGIGLDLVKKIVEAHDGDVQVKSEVGSGSKFTVTLPS